MNVTRRRLQKHRRAVLRTPAWRSNGTSHVFRWSRALDLIERAAVLDGVRGEPQALGESAPLLAPVAVALDVIDHCVRYSRNEECAFVDAQAIADFAEYRRRYNVEWG